MPFSPCASLLVQDLAWARVTPRMVLSHTSGLGNLAYVEPDKKMHLHYKPGSCFLYSGDGLCILQLLLEEQIGKPLDQLTSEALFKPLGMTRIGLAFRPEFAPNVADRVDSNEKFIAKTHRNPRAADSMSTSAEDLARFLTALLANKILSAKPSSRCSPHRSPSPSRTSSNLGPKPTPKAPNPRPSAWPTLSAGASSHTRFGPAFFKEGHGDGGQNYMI
jgi:CubicO group peptidase (beta-lactamase class C family)